MAGRKHILDAAQRERLLRLNRQGVSIDNLATRFGVKRSMVVKTLVRMRRAERILNAFGPTEKTDVIANGR